MGIEDWWRSALGDFSKSPPVTLDKLRGLRVGADQSIHLNRFSGTDVDKLAMTSDPPHPAPDLLASLQDAEELACYPGVYAALRPPATFFDPFGIDRTCRFSTRRPPRSLLLASPLDEAGDRFVSQ